MKQIEVAAGILINDGKILCVQRPLAKYDYISYKYEFPGGKLEHGEDPATALKRELWEEMNLDIDQSELSYFMSVSHDYPDFSITMHCLVCNLPHRSIDLVEHVAFQWLKPNQLKTLDWAAADQPIVNRLVEEYSE
jgi:8-oxo-dGTP diphosphatase